jgi:hypothetical protein
MILTREKSVWWVVQYDNYSTTQRPSWSRPWWGRPEQADRWVQTQYRPDWPETRELKWWDPVRRVWRDRYDTAGLGDALGRDAPETVDAARDLLGIVTLGVLVLAISKARW